MGDDKPFNNPFAELWGTGGVRNALPVGPSQAGPRKPGLEEQKAPARAVVRIERKGRRGKEVTVIEHLELAVDLRAQWLTELKSALGCGGSVEDGALVLQGDQRERAAAWLTKRGVKKVTLG